MLSSMNTVADVETLYARLGERDYEAVMSYLVRPGTSARKRC
jgi:hypothetical protein